MNTLYALLIFLVLFCSKTSFGQALYSYSKNNIPIIKIDTTDKPFVKIFTKFFVTDSGKVKNIEIVKIECSICTDSLINDGKERAIEYIRQSYHQIGYNHGKATGLYYNLPIIFKY